MNLDISIPFIIKTPFPKYPIYFLIVNPTDTY